jgi:ABC-2 type transport system permease protein
MRLETIFVIAKREYLQRIQSKGFWIATLILPLFIGSVTVLPTLLVSKARTRQTVVVVDETGKVAPELTAPRPPAKGGKPVKSRSAEFDIKTEAAAADLAAIRAQRSGLDSRVLAGTIDAWIWIGRDALTSGAVEYHAKNVSNVFTQEVLSDNISAAVRRVRLREAGYDAERVGELSQPVELKTERVSATGSRKAGALAGAAFGYILFFMLYITLAIWGQQVMQGVLEEKSSRVIEVIVSAVKPFELMMGKLTGICAVGLTQFSIWLLTFSVLTLPGILATIATLPEGVTLPTLTPFMVLNFAFLFVLGFFVFSTFYAAIGAAFNNVQEAQQVAGVAVFFLVIPVFLMFRIINDPSSTFATVMSLIPIFTPLLMTLRIALEMPPLWQLLLAYALTLAFIWIAVAACARIYRVGILMYGKKPTFQELWKWMRYS